MTNQDHQTFGCDIIQDAGEYLRLPQIAIATGQILLQRVYNTQDYTYENYPLDITAMAALFLASKIEEYPRKVRELIDVFTYVICDKLNLKQLNKEIVLRYNEHEKIREEVINTERKILKNLGFNLLSSYPHKIIVNYHHAMVNALDKERNFWKDRDNNQILQIAWNYCNDSLRTNIFIKFNEIAVACACIHLACNDVQMPFPRSTDGRPWYKLFIKDELEVEGAIEMIKSQYSRKRLVHENLHCYFRIMDFSSKIKASPTRYRHQHQHHQRY